MRVLEFKLNGVCYVYEVGRGLLLRVKIACEKYVLSRRLL